MGQGIQRAVNAARATQGHLTTGQASREVFNVLATVGLEGSSAVSSRVGMQPEGSAELLDTTVTVRDPEDCDAAMTALLMIFPDAPKCDGDGKRTVRITRFTGRIVRRMCDQKQAEGIRALCGQLGRECPELVHLTWQEAGDLIISLRAELLEKQGKAEQ